MNLSIDHNKTNKLLIEKYYTGELDKAKSMEVEKHVQTCIECKQYYEELTADNKRFLDIHPFNSLINPRVSDKMDMPWYKPLFNFSLQPAFRPVYALILIISIVIPFYISHSPNETSTGIRNKGTDQLSFLYRRDGKIYEGTVKDTFQAHDEIQIIYNSLKKQYISLFSIDSKGNISFYFPENTSRWCSIKTEKGSNIHYPLGMVLDNTGGHELIIVLLTRNRIKVKEVQNWISNLTKDKNVNLLELENRLFTDPIKKKVKILTLLLNKR
jgi:hypothetical protein